MTRDYHLGDRGSIPVPGSIDVYVALVKDLYSPKKLLSSQSSFDEVRAFTIGKRTDSSGKIVTNDPKRWFPLASSLKRLAKLVQLQINYVEGTSTHNASLPNFLCSPPQEVLVGVRKGYRGRPDSRGAPGVQHRYTAPPFNVPRGGLTRRDATDRCRGRNRRGVTPRIIAECLGMMQREYSLWMRRDDNKRIPYGCDCRLPILALRDDFQKD
ncbi:hypothetical protein DPMN_025525 [Dreissena polymorpha]|uniref:Uncharacterized protein n=1 Tax=Dreissena polymorpha TaxID=45954 RepID=A0A9D4RCM4_DREPO|nr:hypothetical protein DPMN_025525 [Dreissena polymorpha]